MPSSFSMRLAHIYKNGDYQTTTMKMDLPEILVRSKRGKNFRGVNSSETNTICRAIRRSIPTLAYYPTFVFSFPERIYLTNRDTSARNKFYRQLFQDILDYDGEGYTIKDSILSRVNRPEHKGVWSKWFGSFANSSDEEKVKQVISRAQRTVTKVVFSAWNDVFGETVGRKEIELELNYEAGNPVVSAGTKTEAEQHDVYIRFWIREGASRYAIEDRSLGFRWFFSFLLFTQFRINRNKSQPTIFMFDEPASNLHAAAQKKLLESFPAIAKSPHRLIYSTHSHYMVEPSWLEQAYIVLNSGASPAHSIVDEGTSDDRQIDIQAIPYRKFVQDHPNRTSYFQPILDTLEVQPSKFDYSVGGIICEGKGDLYYLKLAARITGYPEPIIFPGVGSGTMTALVALHRGWGLPVNVLFDADKGGKDGKRRLRDFYIEDSECFTIKDLFGAIEKIEDIISDADKEKMVGTDYNDRKKTVLLRSVQERLASKLPSEFDATTLERMRSVLASLEVRAPHAFRKGAPRSRKAKP